LEEFRAIDSLSVVLPRLLFIDLFFDLLPERSDSLRESNSLKEALWEFYVTE
jgi:hypothetical protein